MPRYRLTLSYDGSEFVGWQKQEPPVPGSEPDSTGERPREILRTVQQVVEVAVRAVVRQPVVLIGASRTDSGVHALGQTAAFTATGPSGEGRPPDERLAMALNSRLPEDVIVRSAIPTREDFDPIGDCLSKGYVYRYFTSRERPLWERRYVKHVRESLDVEAMDEAVRRLIGEHDFAGFAAAGHGRESTVRTVHEARVERVDDHLVVLRVSGNGFLWNMVRIIAGTLMEIGLGRRSPESIGKPLEDLDRRSAGPTLGPEGLCLAWQQYPGDPAPVWPNR